MRASIIIPTFDRLDLLQACVASIREHTESEYEIVVVDNGSRDGTIDWCAAEKLAFVSLPANAGFPTACNKGLRLATGDTLVLLNNDTIVTARWLDNLLAALYSSPSVGMVGPVANYCSGKQQVKYSYDSFEEFQRIAAEVNRSNPEKWTKTDRLVGFCLAFRREVMERIGLLDERFAPGHFEDDDYCLRARLENFELLICHDCLIHHEGSASFKMDAAAQRRLIERNYRLFLEKWKIDPHVFI